MCGATTARQSAAAAAASRARPPALSTSVPAREHDAALLATLPCGTTYAQIHYQHMTAGDDAPLKCLTVGTS